MQLAIKILALIFALFYFLGFTWWDRSDLALFAKIYWIMPSLALFTIAIIPYRLLSSLPILRWGTSIICAIGTISVLEGVYEAWNSEIEPDTPAIFLRLVILGIFISSLYLMWRKQE